MHIIDEMCIEMLFNMIEPMEQIDILSDYLHHDDSTMTIPDMKHLLMR